MSRLVARKAPRIDHGKHFKAYYALQTGNYPINIRIFCNRSVTIDEPYKRFLRNGFHEALDLSGCPITFELIGKPEREYNA